MSSGSSGAQDWRAVACLAPSGERLLCVGESSSQVRAAYTGAWGEVIRDEDRPTVRAISLQRWAGQFWSGQWEHQMYLAVPTARGARRARASPETEPRLRPKKSSKTKPMSKRTTSHPRIPRRRKSERRERFPSLTPGMRWGRGSTQGDTPGRIALGQGLSAPTNRSGSRSSRLGQTVTAGKATRFSRPVLPRLAVRLRNGRL